MSDLMWIILVAMIGSILLASFPKTTDRVERALKPTYDAVDSAGAKMDRYLSGAR